jgi:hypothetical protein
LLRVRAKARTRSNSFLKIMEKKTKEINLLELTPTRRVGSEADEKQQVTLLIPKFKNRYTVKYLQPLLAKPNFRLKLDTYGSFVWNRIDGHTKVMNIADAMKEHFGESVEPVYERVGKFVHMLQREKFITLNHPQ